jgi:hypothetical protein
MNNVDIDTACLIYDFSSYLVVNPQRLEWAELSDFSLALKRLIVHLSDSATEDYWRMVIRYFKSYRFALSSTPLPPDHSLIYSVEKQAAIKDHLRNCNILYPGLGTPVALLFESQNKLITSKNPIFEAVQKTVDVTYQRIAVLIKETRYVTAVEDIFKSLLSKVNVVTPAQLKGNEVFDEILIIGPARWFPDYLFYSPRASKIQVLTFTFISDSWRRTNPFAGSSLIQSNRARSISKRTSEYSVSATGQTSIDPNELLLQVNWDEISRTGIKSTVNSTQDNRSSFDEEVPAYLLMLEGERAVFLEAFETSRALVIDLDVAGEDINEETNSGVKKVPTKYIDPGMFLLLRTYEGGDYIVPIADNILGAQANYNRALQRNWKDKLKLQVKSSGLLGTCNALTKLGAYRANETNLRNWMSSRLIRPRSDKDFIAILKICGLENQKNNYFDAASKILQAHHSAGRKITQLLVKQVTESDLSKLHRLGQMEFDLPEIGGGSLTAFRVLSIAPETYDVESAKIGVPFDTSSQFEMI